MSDAHEIGVPLDVEPGAEELPPGLAEAFGALLGMAVRGAKQMSEWPKCERRPWPSDDDEVCGAVLLADTSADGRQKHVHYCHADLSLHLSGEAHACICGTPWVENTSGAVEQVGPGETIVRPGEQP